MENAKKLNSEVEQYLLESKNINKRARNNYLEQVSDVSEKLKQISGEAGDKAKQVIDQLGEYIKNNPQRATLVGLGVGIGLGVALGILIRRK
ncbi:MAG: hypothetical protein H7A23_26200 [Leptospiraceae bacterium]|nr:hypothetical protein [Leptospiraceae bacterium]MCP5498063.1 hypothetical protein [Leptospiraceae bacterium]